VGILIQTHRTSDFDLGNRVVGILSTSAGLNLWLSNSIGLTVKKIILILLLALIASSCGINNVEPANEGYIYTSDGVRLFYKIVGSGPESVVAVHGGPGNSLESIMADLEPLSRNRRVIYYDQRGNGRSDLVKDAEELSVAKHVADLEAVRAHFKLGKMTVIGNSWGGMLAAFYAVKYPENVERMILHSAGEPTKASMIKADEALLARLSREFSPEQKRQYASLSVPQVWIAAENPKDICRQYFQLLLPFYFFKAENAAKFKGDVCSGSDETVRYRLFVNEQIMSSLGDWNLLPSLGSVRCPVLVIYGEADPASAETPLAWTRAFPNAKLLMVNEAGHLPHVEQHEIFFDAVETFLGGEFPGEAK
jgi:proline iminopeptidase